MRALKLDFLNSGHENNGPLCHKCGWPFPNPHPSARDREEHEEVCGKIEGYKVSESEAGNSTHSAVSDDNHHSEQQNAGPNGKKSTKEDNHPSEQTVGIQHTAQEIPRDASLQGRNANKSRGIVIETPGLPNPDDLDYELLIEVPSPQRIQRMEGELVPLSILQSHAQGAALEKMNAQKQEQDQELNAEVGQGAGLADLNAHKQEVEVLEEEGDVQVPLEVLNAAINGEEFVLIVEKKLEKSDVNKGRLSLPREKSNYNFLSPIDLETLETTRSLGIVVRNIEGQPVEMTMKLYLNGGSSKNYIRVFASGWKIFVQK